MKKLILSLVFLAFTAQATQAQWGNRKVEGNGKMTTVFRSVSEYNGVSLEGFMDVELVRGNEGSLKVEAEENLQEYIITEVNNGQLEISVQRGTNLKPSQNRSIKVTVPFEDLEEVKLTGSGDIYSSAVINAENFETSLTGSGDIKLPVKAKNARANITGSGDIELEGSANDFVCKVTGSGDISAFNFECERVKATIIGSGDIQVYATEELQANIPGAGDIEYRGNPKKEDFKTLGVGSISKK